LLVTKGFVATVVEVGYFADVAGVLEVEGLILALGLGGRDHFLLSSVVLWTGILVEEV
jgi:uncharacterized membrane protein